MSTKRKGINLNLAKPKDARFYVNYWAEGFKASTGKEASMVTLNTGREVHFATMSDEDAVLIANDLYRMSLEADTKTAKSLAKAGRIQ
jgi:hypothetical protein